jgi:hypothetical protein
MTPFADSLTSWHDFYLAVGSASAALLGLLFVGVSISLSALSRHERLDVTSRANLAFSNLLYLVGLSLVVLLPGVEPSTVAISFIVIAGLGLLRTGRQLRRRAFASGSPHAPAWQTIRRLAWTILADLLLAATAVEIASTGDGRWLLVTPIVVLVLLLGAADVAWDLLVRESEQPDSG